MTNQEEIEERLDELNELRDSVRLETLEQMGSEAALRIQEVHTQNWIDLAEWFTEMYKTDKEWNMFPLVFLQLFNKLGWMQSLFLGANYGAVNWHTREALEGMALALSVSHRGRSLSIDGQMERAMEIEESESAKRWVESALRHVLDYDDEETADWMNEWWTLLNKHVHASPQRMSAITLQRNAGVLVMDAYDEELANETLSVVDEVFDVIWAIMLSEYSELIPRAADKEYFPTDREQAPHVAYVISSKR